MGRGSTGLDSSEYDDYLSEHRKEKELRARHIARKNANKGYEGWHFGCGEKPFHTKGKEDFKRELDKRGLMMGDDVKKRLR